MLRTLRELWAYRELMVALVGKELKLRYRRSVLGFAWTMLNPLFTMLILSAVFGHLMRAQIERFPVFVLAALLPWNFFAQSTAGGAFAIIYNESLLRNVRVPRAVFPVALVTSHLVNFLLAMIPLGVVMLWQGSKPSLAILMLPIPLLFIWTFTVGVSLLLSAGTVFFRDLGQIVEVSLTALFYLTPVLYPMSMLPPKVQQLVMLNPVAHLVLPFRQIFHEGAFPTLSELAIGGSIAAVTFLVGLEIFRRREHLFLPYLS